MSPSKSHKRGRKKKSKPTPSPPQNFQPETLETVIRASEVEEENEDEELKKKRDLDMKLLMNAFETISIEEIVSVYEETDYDAFKAAGILGETLVDPEIGEKKETRVTKKNKNKKNKGGVSCGMVANVIGKEYVKKISNSNSNPNFGEGRVKGKDMKYKIEEGEEFLCAMLGDHSELGMGVVKDVLGQCGFDVEKALDALLDISDTSTNQFIEKGDGDYPYIDDEFSSSSSSENSINLFQVFDDEFSSSSSSENSINLFQHTNKTTDLKHHPPDKGINLSPYEGYGCRNGIREYASSEKQLPSQSRGVNTQLQQKVLESLFKIPDNSARDANSMDWKKVVQQVESFGQGLEFRNANITHPCLTAMQGKEDEYEVCRSVARKHKTTMKTYFQKAAAAFSRGERANAAQLSETGRMHRRLACKADDEASREIFEARNRGITNTVTIDLHGQHVKQGIGLLKLHLMLFKYIPSVQFLRVITGSGGHSSSGKGKLKRSVIALVKKEVIEWCQENSGTLVLKIDGSKEYSFMEEDNDVEDD